MLVSIFAVLAVCGLAFGAYMWSQGNPRVESFRDDCKNWASLWRTKGLPEVARFFDRWPEYRESVTLDAMREKFADFNDAEWFRQQIALPLFKAEAKGMLSDPASRARVQQVLREAGYDLTTAPTITEPTK